jgi:hypothetical protein
VGAYDFYTEGIHYPLEVPKRFFDRYSSQGANTGDCIWDKQTKASNGYPNGFDCTHNTDFPLLPKPGLDCECNRLLVKAQVAEAQLLCIAAIVCSPTMMCIPGCSLLAWIRRRY